MASSFPLNMCITMEPPVRYDTYHAIGVPPFMLIFAQSTTLLLPLTVVFGASINGRRHSHAGHQEKPRNRLEAVVFARQMHLAQSEDRRPSRGAALEPIRRLLARRPRGNSATSVRPVTAHRLMDRLTGEVVATMAAICVD